EQGDGLRAEVLQPGGICGPDGDPEVHGHRGLVAADVVRRRRHGGLRELTAASRPDHDGRPAGSERTSRPSHARRCGMELRRNKNALAAVALLAVAAVAGCGGGSSGGSAALGTGGGHATTHRLTDTANGSTAQVHVGDTINVVLHSTYWQLTDP